MKRNEALKVWEVKMQKGNEHIYLNSKDGAYAKSYMTIQQRYDDSGDLCEYSYRFVAPHIDCVLDSENNNKSKTFEFRYESHPDKDKSRPWPTYHLHVFEGVPPKYKSEDKISIEDFFKVIEEALSSDKKYPHFNLA